MTQVMWDCWHPREQSVKNITLRLKLKYLNELIEQNKSINQNLPDLIESEGNGKERDDKNAASIVIVVVWRPQDEAEDLEHIEWVEHL